MLHGRREKESSEKIYQLLTSSDLSGQTSENCENQKFNVKHHYETHHKVSKFMVLCGSESCAGSHVGTQSSKH